MNIRELNASYEGGHTCGCIFRNTVYAQGHEQTYTYLVPEWLIVEKGDLAIVEKGGVYSIVTVNRIDETSKVDPNAPYRYKWLVGKVSPELYNARVEAENKSLGAQSRV